METAELLSFYRRHAEEDLLPFWMRALDLARGGVYTCFDNAGKLLVGTDKYTWSQGRMIWLLAQAASMMRRGLLAGDEALCLEQARRTVAFLREHAFLDNGNCAYLLTEDGRLKEALPGLGHDISFFADCFVALGFARYAQVAEDADVLEAALGLYRRIVARLAAGDGRSEPYPVPAGYEAHATPMILLCVSDELAEALETHGHPAAGEVRADAVSYMDDIMDRFRDGAMVREMLPADPGDADTLLSRHLTPGHALESMWFVMRAALRAGRRERIGQAADVIARMFRLGWDDEAGGLFRYIDRDGGEPRGRLIGGRYEDLVRETWDMKLWWPHSEALYALLLAWRLTGRDEFRGMYGQAHEYVFRTFPNPDKTVGEWIQIRDRQGRPVEKTVALPVKDPFHILRNVLLIIELLADGSVNATADAPRNA